jgi:hypothetical protein
MTSPEPPPRAPCIFTHALIERTKIEIGRGGETSAATKPAAQLGLMLVRNAARLLHAP